MLIIKNTNKKTAMGGVGIALLLCILMALSPMTGLVQNETQTETVEYVAATEADDYDYFALPDVYEPAQYEHDETSEIEGMRSMNQKAFRTEDGKTSLITASEPLHYLERDGSWDEIDLSVKATVNGWEVTENNYQTSFPAEFGDGVAVTVHPNVDPIITGMVPMVMTIDISGGNPMPFQTTPSHEGVSIGGNMIRYPIAEGFDLDYTVETNQVKQNLVIRERPVLDDNVAWFGLAEQLRLPVGHALYLGDDILREDLTQTQEELSIRNIETGEIIAVLPVPVVMEMEAIEPYHATYFVQVFGQTVVLTTAVESSWLLDEDRQFPLAIDPTIKVTSNAGGYCYVYYGYCYNSSYRYLYRYYARQYYMPWNKYTFTSANALPTGATVDQIDWKQYVSYSYSYSSNVVTAVVMESCGTSNRYSYSIPTASCSGLLTALSYGYGGTTQRKMISSLWNSAAAGTYSLGTGWKTSTLCSSTGTACSSSTGSHNYITNALTNSGSVGMGAKYLTSTYTYTYAYTGGNSNSYIQITYSGGSDTTAPTSEFVPYTGITSYKEGERTFFTTFSDMSGIDTTAAGQPDLYYSVNNGSYTSVSATTIGTCGATDSECQFSAQTGNIAAGDFVNYYWAFQDLASTPNTATDPSGGTGSTAPSTTYWFFVDDVDNAGTAKKFTTLITDRYASSSFTPGAYFDQQMTYYDNSDEYVIEFDTSDCGTGSTSCFYTTSYYFYSQWKMMWTTSSSSGYNGLGGTKSGDMEMHQDDGGFLTIAADDGPGMNLIYLYDSSANDWAMVGLGTGTGIDEPLSGGTSATYATTYGYTESFRVSIPGDFTGTFGKFDFNATYSSSGANWMCVSTNGWYYFFRSTSSNPICTSGYYYIYSTSYRWAGMAFGSGYYGRQAASGDITFKVGSVAPEPDTYAPTIGHDVMKDSHARDRTFSYTIGDAGDPPSGLNVNATAGEGPTLYYRTTAADGTVGNWASNVLSPLDKTRSECILNICTWTTTVEDMERNSSTEYYLTAEDNSTVATGVNSNTTATNSFSVGDPNKMFIVEWHDLGYTSSYTCNFQVVMYDVTNEIEFQYDTNCEAYYDYATVGYQDQTRTMGATLQQDAGYMAGSNPFSNNYRIATESGGHSSETFDLGMTELPTYDTAIRGSSNGAPYGYYCVSSYYWSTYKAGCNANVDLPDGFTFDYFGKEYNGSDSKNRVHIGRMGNMYLKDDGSTALENSMATWYSNMPDMPYNGHSMSKPGNIAPWWGYYSSYYCYDTSSLDCSVRTRIVPFEGKGTDISADITQPTTWALIDSPIRVNPSNDYLSIGHNLTIEPGVVIQVASGKGLSFDGTCNPFIAVGNSTDHIVFEGQNNGTWKGLAFTGACSATDNRHMMSYVDFADTTDAAIAAGSRHGATPSSNANVGNFTMDHITFTDVGEAFAHGSGQGTALTISDFEVNNAANACFNFAEDTVATLTDGEMDGCNDDGTSWGGAVVNYPGSTAGALIMENVDISNSQVNLIDVDLATVWISNVTGSTSSAQSGTVLGAAGDGTGSSLYIYNMDADGYSSGSINSLDSISMNTVDWGTADIAMAPGGPSSTAAGPSGSNAVFDTFTAGDLTMARMAPMMDNIDIGALTVSGNAPGSDAIEGSSWSTDGISVNGCGYKVIASDVSTDWVSGSCSNAASPNTIILSDVTGTYTGAQSAIYARNSDITIGEGTWTMPTSFDKLAKASTDAMIVLIAVTQDGTACDGSGACDTSSGSSGDIYFGGLATVKVYKLLGSGVKSYRSGHTVQATVVDAGAGLFTVGTHRTDANGEASVWVIAVRDNGDTYADHNLAAWGPAGQNETLVSNPWYPGSFEIGDSIELRLEPAPVALNGTNMDCAYLENHPEAVLGYDAATNTFTWEGKITMSGDLIIDSCTVIVKNVFRVASDATNNPVLTIGTGGVLEFSSTSTDVGTLQAVSASYPLHLDMDGGTLIIDNGVVRDLAPNGVGTTGGLVADSGTVTIMNGSTIYGNSGASNNHATILASDGTFDFDDSTIINVGQTGMGLLFAGSYGTADNIVVKNADVGIASIDAAPAVNGFNVQDSTSGVLVYGGMSLPTIYRSTLLSGQSTGWTTYGIDMSGYLEDDYLQVGMNSIYAGGNAHPSYNYYSSKYYMIYDRMRIELTDDTGASWNVTNSSDEGYVNGGGWDCNYYGYTYNPDYDYGYYYYMINYGGLTLNGSYNEYPSDFGFRWEAISDDITPTYAYPMHYWGYYSPSAYFTGVYAPPEGFNGMWGTYNVCLDYAATYYVSSGQGARTAYPVIDISGSNITGVKMYVDVLHNRADNYQDRLDVVARSSDDVSELGAYARESGTPSFANGQVTGADTGLAIGGAWAAVDVDNVTVSNPITAGLLVDGSVASSINGLTVEGGNYGVLMSSAASGSIDVTNAAINNSARAGVYYIKDVGGEFTGTITNSAGAGMKFGTSTTKDISWSGMSLATNAIGVETAGSGTLKFTDSTFGNAKDFVITGSAGVDFIEGNVDATTVEVTGSGTFERMRQLDVNVIADSNAVVGTNVLLMNADGLVTGTQTSDASGDALDLLFTTITVNSGGLIPANLSGYQAVTVAKIGTYSYTNSANSGDFRYGFESVSLSDASGNSATMDLVDNVDSRICYSWTSTYYVQIAACAGSLSTSGSRTYTSGLKEYGYYGGSPADMSNQVIMADVPWWYMDGGVSNNFNETTILNTGGYTSYATTTWYSTTPYGGEFWMHDGEVISLAVDDDGEMQGVEIGYFYGAYLLPNIQNSTLSGIASIASSHGYKSYWSNYNWEADMFTVKDSTITHFRSMENTGSVAYEDMCFIVAGSNVLIEGNTISNCAVGVFLQRTPYYYYLNSTYWGADDAVIKDNDFKDTETIDIWFYLNSQNEGTEISGNTFSGSSNPSYSVYTQDSTTSDLLIDGNTFLNADEPIYMRGATDWTITDNVITGKSDAALAGIYVKDGYGVIDGNTMTDADGGILVDGVKYGYEANVTNNNIGQTAGRIAPAAVGIWAEDCGSSQVNTGGNDIEVMENAIVTDGCDLTDTGSTLTAIGGTGGSVSSVQVNANAFTPASLSIDTGDTIRWRANEYYNNSGTGEPHTVTSNDTDSGGQPLWGSNGIMNLGSTYTRTFNTVGTYEYHCATHNWMSGVVTVANGTSGTVSSVGFSVAGGTDEIVLDGTTISGFGTAIEQYGGEMTLTGGATLNGGSYGAYAEDTDVIIDGASLSASSTGSALYVLGTSSLDAANMDTAGLYGINTDAVDFRWNYGNSVATTAVMADGGAEGSVENVTWAESTTQIDAGSYVTITSVGNSLVAANLIVDPTAVIHEGNLLNLNVSHKGGDATDVGLMIKSTDGAQAAYVSPAYRAPYVSADGDLSEWTGNVLNPADDAMPGVMSGDGSEDFLTTWDANNLYMALTGVDMASADLQIYIDSSTGGETTGQSWYVAHSLPFAADYVYWAEDGTGSNSGLKVNGFTGWADITSSCSGLGDYIGNSANTNTEIAIPWDCIGSPSDTVRIIVVVQNESDGGVASVHPDQTLAAGNDAQSFNDEITLMMGHSDLAAGDDLRDHLLIFRSYVGSNNPSDAKTYDLSVLVNAACEKDWGLIEDVDMSTNTWEAVNIERACPAISDLVDIAVNEDSGAYTLTLLDKATDVQDADNTLTWSVSDDLDPTNSPSMLLDSGLNVINQEMTITPDNDQFGSYMFHYTVTDSNGLSDSATIVFTVVNVNDAPIICNDERTDCMPVFADDGADNLNVLDEGFGSVSKVLGSAANATGSYVIDMASNDMANEQPQVYTWGARIKGDDVTVDAYWVQKKYSSVAAMFDEVSAVITASGAAQDLDMTGDPSAHEDTDVTYTLPTLNNVTLLTYLLAQNGCGSVWYQEYMDTAGNKVSGIRSDDGCDSTIDTYGNVYSGLNYTQFWETAYGVDVSDYSAGWSDIFTDGYSTTAGNNPCGAFGVNVNNNELTITEDTSNELGGECTIVLTLNDDGGYCANLYMGRTTNAKASCVAYTWLINYPVNHPVYGPITVTGCYNIYLGLPSFIPEYYPSGQATGMTQGICLAYSWNAENTIADEFEVNFSVTPVNDAPEVLDWDRPNGVNIVAGNGTVPNFPWKVTLTEDDETLENLVYDLSAMKADADHADEDLVWSIVKGTTCDYEEYFSATINGDDISFDLIKDATTNAPEWEVDYLNNGGRHQQNPASGEFCPITLYLHDSPTAPDAIPNYGMTTADYQQGEDSVTIYVRVQNVAENVPDYFLKDEPGFDFNGVTNVMTKTYVPTTVKIGHGGDEGPYNYDHMLQVTFMSNGYNNDDPTNEGYVTLGTQYVSPPAYGEDISVSDEVFVTSTSTRVWATVDVLTCVDATCDMSKSPDDRFFGHSFPEAHRCIDSNDVQGEEWSCPGEVGRSSVDATGQPSTAVLKNNRRPMLEDQAWCNNIMSSEESGSDCAQPRTFGEMTLATGQDLPTVVRLIGTSAVPSFAPSLIAISAAGLFVSALVLQSRREEEEEALEKMSIVDDETAVSPVIATILMVAITVVLSGVIYVWAASLAQVDTKGVPRMTFTVDSSSAIDGDNGHHRIVVSSSQVDLATQAIDVRVQWASAGELSNVNYNLADPTIYGFGMDNTDTGTMVTFVDSVDTEKGATKSTFNTGDTIFIRTVDADGNSIEGMTITITYNPGQGQPGAVLRQWNNL